MAQPTGSSYSALILPKPGKAPPAKLPKAAKATPPKLPGTPSLRAPIPAQALTAAQGSQVKARAKALATPQAKAALKAIAAPPKHGSGGNILDALESAGAAVIPALVTKSTGVPESITKPATNKAQAVTKALVNDPTGTLSHTATSIPGTLNALITGTARTGLETLAEAVAARSNTSPAEVLGVKPGKPGEALESMGKTIAQDYKTRYGSSVAHDQARIEKEGLLPEILDATTVLGGTGAVAGRAASKAFRAAGTGAEDFAKVAKYREALTHALQAPSVQEYLKRKDAIPPEPSKAQRRAAALHESAAQPRPNLRSAPGAESPSIKRGGAVLEQDRSPNLFRALGQTKLDDARRARQQATLDRVMQARQAAADPNLSHELIPQSFASQLALDTRRGEVAPIMQRGSKNLGPFFGAEKAQRIGAAYGKGEQVRARRGVGDAYQQTFNEVLKGASKEQKKLLVYAKEGHIPLNNPEAATRWLQEIHDQAAAGHDALRIPLQHTRGGSDVAKETGALLQRIHKIGPENVFTPHFAKLVEQVPDERLVSPKDPVLQQNPDAAIARKYLPQQHMLEQWAERHPHDPHAASTKAAAVQIHQLLEEGHDLRLQALQKGSDALHAKATDKFATAKNLADENARVHGLPTDRAYIEHTQSMEKNNWLHTVPNASPADYKHWKGILQKAGYRSTDPELVLRAALKSIRNDYGMKSVNAFEQRFAVKLPRSDMTAAEVHRLLADSGRNPADYQVVHFGKLRAEMTDHAAAEHLVHLNSDPETHARSLEQSWLRAGDTPLTDTTKGASLIPKAAFEEMRSTFRSNGFLPRTLGKLKGKVSKLMLGTSLPWATTMSAVTYPVQSLMGGGGPFDFLSNAKYYRRLTPGDKAAFDQAFGVDNPHRPSSHGYEAEKLGSALPQRLDGLVHSMQVARQSPIGSFLSKANPVDAVIRMERGPRRYSRINVATKGLKTEALRSMIGEMHGAQAATNKFELGLQKLLHTGRMPAQKYMDKAMANTKAVEQIARHADRAMGEWHNMTQFERNHLNKYIMFYPWLRYSLKLVAHTLPAHHPLLYAIALKLGTWEHKNLVELLGTEPQVGSVYLGKAQPHIKPEKRVFSEIGIKQANPTMNTATEALAGAPSELLDMLPPYMSSALGWAVGKNLFTDKPLKGAHVGESKEVQGRPNFLRFMLHENVEAPFSPARTASKLITGGRPQSPESLPLLGSPKPVQYSRKVEREIAKENEKRDPLETLGKELFPLLPHSTEGRLESKIRAEKREAKEEKKNARKQRQREHKTSGPGAGFQGLPGQ